MKQCSVCSCKKPMDCFTKRKSAKDGCNAACKECTRSRSKKHYAENKKYYSDKAKLNNKKYRAEIQSKLRKMKEDTACTDCNQYYPHYVMDFDHIKDKEFNLSTAADRQIAWARIEKEIAKCEIVCSNCHRERTWSRAH